MTSIQSESTNDFKLNEKAGVQSGWKERALGLQQLGNYYK